MIVCTILMFLTFSATAFCNSEEQTIEGDWEIVEYQEGGKHDPAGGGVGKFYRFTEKRIVALGEGNNESYACQIDSKKKHLDWYVRVGEMQLLMKSIYIVNGDTLRISRAFPGAPRPTSFKSSPGDQVGVFVLQRKE